MSLGFVRFNDLPFFRLETEVTTICWMLNVQRSYMAGQLHQMYPGGCVVCTDTCRAMATVDRRGSITEIPQPWPEIPIVRMVNNPKVDLSASRSLWACPCTDYWDPEAGTWGARGRPDHHPLCMYRSGAMARYARVSVATASAAGMRLDPVSGAVQRTTPGEPVRPDILLRTLAEIPG
jgi:hypothetical protein